MGKAKATHSSSSSTDSSKHPTLSSASSSPLYHHHHHHHHLQPNTATNRNLITDLRLGLNISVSSSILDALLANSSLCRGTGRGQEGGRKQASSHWPPLKPLLRSSLAERESGNHRQIRPTFFVKVHMEGVPIGRKVDLLAHHDYDGLITTLAQMFRTSIMYPDMDRLHSERNDHNVLTYEDKEGDWMMVGDVPWEIFLTTMRRLKIAGAGKC